MAHLSTSGESEPGDGRVEDDILALEEDVTKDGEADTSVGLDTTEAGGACCRGEVDVGSGNGVLGAGDDDANRRESGRAREGVSTLAVVVLGTGDLGVVGGDSGLGQVEEGGAGVSDGIDGGGDGGAAADGVTGGSELPESVGRVDVDVADGTGVLGGVNLAEVVGAGGVVLQAGGEDGQSERALDGVEEGGLLHRRHRVDAAEGEAEQAVGVSVLGEGARDGGGGLDGLGGRGHTADGDFVGVDLAGRARAVTVRD